jgi:hypothetical protein
MLSPEGPTGGAIRQAILNDEADGGVDDASGVVAAGVGEVGHVGIEILATAGAIMLGVDQDDVAGSAGEGIAQVVESASGEAVAIGAMAASRTGPPAVIAALAGDFGLGKVVEVCGAFGGVGGGIRRVAAWVGSWKRAPTRNYEAQWRSVHKIRPVTVPQSRKRPRVRRGHPWRALRPCGPTA